MQNLSGLDLISRSTPPLLTSGSHTIPSSSETAFSDYFAAPAAPVYNPTLPALYTPASQQQIYSPLQDRYSEERPSPISTPEQFYPSVHNSNQSSGQGNEEAARAISADDSPSTPDSRSANPEPADNMSEGISTDHDQNRSAGDDSLSGVTVAMANEGSDISPSVVGAAGARGKREGTSSVVPADGNGDPVAAVSKGRKGDVIASSSRTLPRNKDLEAAKQAGNRLPGGETPSAENPGLTDDALAPEKEGKADIAKTAVNSTADGLTREARDAGSPEQKGRIASRDHGLTITGSGEKTDGQTQARPEINEHISESLNEGRGKSRLMEGRGSAARLEALRNGQGDGVARAGEAAAAAGSDAGNQAGDSGQTQRSGDSRVLASMSAVSAEETLQQSGGESGFGDNARQQGNNDQRTFSNLMFRSASQAPVSSGNAELQVFFGPEALASGAGSTPSGTGAEGSGSPARMSSAELMEAFRAQFRGQLGSDIVRQARYVLRGQNAGEISLILKPENLGRVRIRMNLEDKSIAGRIIVENNTVKEAFAEAMDELREAFTEQGFDDFSLDISLENGDGGDFNEASRFTMTADGKKGAVDPAGQLETRIASAQAYIREYKDVNILA